MKSQRDFINKMKNLIDDINKVIENSNENVAILINEINSMDYIYNYNSNIKLVSASIIKVPIMLAVLNEIRKGRISFNDKILVKNQDILDDSEVFENGENNYSIYELINWMIIKSDNTATNVIIKTITMEKINNYITNVLNTKSTYLQRYMLDENAIKNGFNNYTSQMDMLNIFTKLFNREILNTELCDIAIKILNNQRCQNQVMRYIYDPVEYAHKTGSLDYLNHDVGVMKIKNKQFYIGISVYNSNNKKGNKQLIGNLGRMTYEYLKIKQSRREGQFKKPIATS